METVKREVETNETIRVHEYKRSKLVKVIEKEKDGRKTFTPCCGKYALEEPVPADSIEEAYEKFSEIDILAAAACCMMWKQQLEEFKIQ